ncbi:unnamed protein product [Litomosoides sigmodontis]|uniref:Uncharacterized protein n=1 Tax=Litomosoides sigmodontis TaxID=42156 RepID=A0A3P6TUK6_LITSI|nr:unnamed protein product [Litomosoides sigmodontis]
MVLLVLSAIWHCFAWPNPMSVLQWNFGVRPQVNFKPQISLVVKSQSEPQMSSTTSRRSDQTKIARSQSETIQCKMSGKVDLGIDIRLKNTIPDSVLTVYEIINNSLSLASWFASSVLGRSLWTHSRAADDLHLSASDGGSDRSVWKWKHIIDDISYLPAIAPHKYTGGMHR